MKPKRLPRLWCALQGLLPLEVRFTAAFRPVAPPAEHTHPTPVAVRQSLATAPLPPRGRSVRVQLDG